MNSQFHETNPIPAEMETFNFEMNSIFHEMNALPYEMNGHFPGMNILPFNPNAISGDPDGVQITAGVSLFYSIFSIYSSSRLH